MRQFTVTDEEQKQIREWDKCAKMYHGAIGGHLSYSFTPTSLGDFLTVSCCSCGEELHLNDNI